MGYRIRVLAKSQTTIPMSQLEHRLTQECIEAKLELSVTGETQATWTQLLLKHADNTMIAVIERDAVVPGSLGEEEMAEFAEDLDDHKPASAAQWLRDYFPNVLMIYAIQILSGADQGCGWDAIHAVQGEIWGDLGGIFQADMEGFTNEEGYHILWQFSTSVKGPCNMAILDADNKWIAFQMDLGNKARRKAFLAGKVPAGAELL